VTTLWSNAYRERYLLIPTIEFPLSADTGAWPQAYDWPERSDTTADLDLAKQLFENFYYVVGGPVFYRFSPDGMELSRSLPPSRGHVIALGVQTERAERLLAYHPYPGRFQIMPTDDVRCTSLLGYDVCDYWFSTLLVYCGIDPDQMTTLRKEFGPDLNRHGLFEGMEAAVRFAAVMDEMIPEHAPTMPVGLYAFANLD
jgi:hypothetical protein